MAPTKLLLFGDGTVDPVDCIRTLARDAHRLPSLNAFLKLTVSALRADLAKAVSPAKHTFPRFTSILQLAEWYAASATPQVTIFPVLLVTAQIGVLLREHELDPAVSTSADDSPLFSIGLCNGMIAAAAAATCRSVVDLLTVGPRLVCLNLRLMLAAVDRSRAIDSSDGTWTILTPGMGSREHEPLIAKFIKEEYLTKTPAHQPYISAESEGICTISGPPPVLSRYFASSEHLRKAKTVQTQINAAFHASHLWKPDLQAILGDDPMWKAYPIKSSSQMLSINTGQRIDAVDLGSLLLYCMDEVLNKQFRWGVVLSAICQEMKQMPAPVTVLPLGPDRISAAVLKALTDSGISARLASSTSTDTVPVNPAADDVAIVGASTRLPGAETLEEVWQLLKEGRDVHRQVPPDRFDLSDHYDPEGRKANTTSSPFGCFIDRPGLFDARLFNMSPREARQTDPMQRLSLLTTYEALEMAGYSPNALPSFESERVGTFWGQTIDDYRETNAAQEVDIYYISGGVRAFGPGRMNYHFKWEGPSMSVDTACSSSALAVQLAFQALRSGECDLAVAGGANIITGPDMYAGLSRGGFLSKTGPCKTFDDEADGYCRGDGVGAVVLKRLKDAVEDGDNIMAVIKSCATNHSVLSPSITRPDSSAQVKVMSQVLRDAGLQGQDIDYVEMHGTGTQVGDATELDSVCQVFRRDKQHPLSVGSIKANVGHGEAAAGINSLIKVILMLRFDGIPPHIGIRSKTNHRFSVSQLDAVTIDGAFRHFPRYKGTRRRIVLNSFNATGGNTAMLIEDAPVPTVRQLDTRTCHIITITGRTQKAFERNRQQLVQHLRDNPDVRIADLAYTTTSRRVHHHHRVSLVASDVSQLYGSISRDIENGKDSSTAPLTAPPLVFVFSGQGNLTFDMAAQLLRTSATFRYHLTACDDVYRHLGLPSIMQIFSGNTSNLTQSGTELQSAIVAVQLALVKTLETWGLVPQFVIGHSIGEYAALVAAGILTEVDALYLAGSRARMMGEHCNAGHHSMLAAFADETFVKSVLADSELDDCTIACLNGPNTVVVSGPVNQLSQASEALSTRRVKTQPVSVDFGFHSPQMRPVAEELRRVCRHVTYRKPKIPVASTLLGHLVHSDNVFDADYLAEQTLRTVKFEEALHSIAVNLGDELQKTFWVEIGTHPTCGPMVTSTLGIATTQVLHVLRRNIDPWQTISKALAQAFDGGLQVNWPAYHSDHRAALSVTKLPGYAFDLEEYWIPYRNSWRLLKGGKSDDDTQSAIISPSSSPVIDPRLAPFHWLKHEDIGEANAVTELVVRFAHDAELLAMINGHSIENVGLCPSSVYAHLAMHGASYLLEKVNHAVRALSLDEMEIISPFKIASSQEPPTLDIRATWNWERPNKVLLEMATNESVHCRCAVSAADPVSWSEDWREDEYLIQSRIDAFQPGQKESINTMYRNVIYALFDTAIVKYSKPYQLIRRIAIDYEEKEAVAQIEVPNETETLKGSPGPFCLDSLMHMAGFVLNSDPSFPANAKFIASGWSSLRLAEALRGERTYTVHTRMLKSSQEGVYTGTVTVMDGDRIVGKCRGLRFHRLSSNSLKRLLGVEARSVATTASSNPSDSESVGPALRDPVRVPNVLSAGEVLTSPRSGKGVLDHIMSDIASETGVHEDQLRDNTRFSELGIDSLLTISLLRRFETSGAMSLPANIFTVCETIGQLKSFVTERLSEEASLYGDDKKRSERPYTSITHPGESVKSRFNTRKGRSPKDSSDTASKREETKSEILCAVIAKEVDCSIEDVRTAASVSDLGIDSLMTISIGNSFREQTGGELDAKFFYDNTTFDAMVQALDQDILSRSMSQPSDSSPVFMGKSSNDSTDSLGSSTDTSHFTSNGEPSTPPTTDLDCIECVSMLIQGKNQPDTPALFLLPDGSGSLFSYIHLPKNKLGIAVHALDSPFHKNPQDYNITFTEVASIYVRQIRGIQPHGPYLVGGWSLGGVHAYEVVRLLLEAGETVKHLVMLDSPCPGMLPPLPHASLDLLEKAGIFQGLSTEVGSVADHTRQHFVRVTNAFQHWKSRALSDDERARLGKATIIWAEHGVLEDDEQARTAWVPGMEQVDTDMLKAKEWLTGKRYDFGPGGWDALVGQGIQCLTVDGNHFSIMFPPVVNKLGSLIDDVLSG